MNTFIHESFKINENKLLNQEIKLKEGRCQAFWILGAHIIS